MQPIIFSSLSATSCFVSAISVDKYKRAQHHYRPPPHLNLGGCESCADAPGRVLDGKLGLCLRDCLCKQGRAVYHDIEFNKFTVTFTCIHTATWLAARALCAAGIITPNRTPKRAVVALAGAFAGYIVLCNVSLSINYVGFCQLTKIAIAPTVMIMEAVTQRHPPPLNVAACVCVICVGTCLATMFGTQVMSNVSGLVVGVISVLVSAQYGTWIGSMTKQHGVTPLQLLEQYLPYASLMIAICAPMESVVMTMLHPTSATIWTFLYSHRAIAKSAIRAALGVSVTFSTFLVIGNTSPLTYAIAGHDKTIAILGGGVFMFGDQIPIVKMLGIAIALGGVFAYTRIKMMSQRAADKPSDSGAAECDPIRAA